jgi:hypothetical protein
MSWTRNEMPPSSRIVAAFSNNDAGTPPPLDKSSIDAGKLRDANTLKQQRFEYYHEIPYQHMLILKLSNH